MKRIEGTRDDDGLSPAYDETSWVYGLNGDDRLYFEDYSRDDRFFGGGGDDVLRDVEMVLPAGRGALVDGLFFDGGPGFDTVEMELRVDASGARVKLPALYGTLIDVELVEVELELDAQDSRPLDALRLVGSRRDDRIELSFDDDTTSTGLRARLGLGDDTVEILEGGHTGARFGFGRGDDLFEVKDGGLTNVVVKLGGGRDAYVVDPSSRFSANDDTVTVHGGRGADTFVLGRGEETVRGGGGKDVFALSGGEATDKLIGGRGADEFVFSLKGLRDGAAPYAAEIGDFKSGVDKLVLVGWTGTVTDVPLVLDIEDSVPDLIAGYVYDQSSGVLSWGNQFQTVDLIAFGAGTTLETGDLVQVNTYDFGLS